jgi:hypothetical protein
MPNAIIKVPVERYPFDVVFTRVILVEFFIALKVETKFHYFRFLEQISNFLHLLSHISAASISQFPSTTY